MTQQEILKNNRLIAEFMGYYQPKEAKEDLHSFEVYASLDNCKKDYPNEEIIRYTGGDIEGFSFIDSPQYHKSWDWLMPVVEKIKQVCELSTECPVNYKRVELFKTVSIFSDISEVYKCCVDFIKWYNENKAI